MSREQVVAARQQRARALGLCGERFGHLGVCDEPADHQPIAPPDWMHSGRIGEDSPLGDLLAELTQLDEVERVLVAHQRRSIGSCLCGWAELGRSHPAHVAEQLRLAGLLTESERPGR